MDYIIPNNHTIEKEITNKGPVLMRKYESPILRKFHTSFWNMLLPMLTTE